MVSSGWPTTTLAAPGEENKVLHKMLKKLFGQDRTQWVWREEEGFPGKEPACDKPGRHRTVPLLWQQAGAGQTHLSFSPACSPKLQLPYT